jgi:dienelactone hydrolase
MRSMFCVRIICIAITLFSGAVHAQLQIKLDNEFNPTSNSPVGITGAPANAVLTIVATRNVPTWKPGNDGRWKAQPTRYTAWVEVSADKMGRIDLATATPISGSYLKADPLGLLWSGYPDGRTEIPLAFRDFAAASERELNLYVLQNGKVVASGAMNLNNNTQSLRVSTVQQQGFVGVFAAPKGRVKLPTLIVMHGSEGSTLDTARSTALTYAQQGFATFALAWYVQAYEATEHVPTSGHLIDVNQLERVRDWLMQQPEADIRRVGLWGVSKGGEFSMLAASRFDWVKAAVGCVPSDVVWQGFGEDENKLPLRSTWSLDGKPLPFVPLFPYATDNRYRDNTDRYERSRRFNPDAAAAARIPIEKTRAKLLLIAGDRDEVWASGQMARNIADTMRRNGKAKHVQTMIFNQAGHSVCGDGSFPVRAYGKDDPDPDRKRLNAEGHANVEAFRGTIVFLREALQ